MNENEAGKKKERDAVKDALERVFKQDPEIIPARPRDPARIDRVLEKVAIAWKKHHTLRLFQLLINLAHQHEHYLYSLEDDVLENLLDSFIATGQYAGVSSDPYGHQRPPR